MFERLSEGFGTVFRKLSGKGSISESNVREAMADVRSALLDADVHLDVVNTFCDNVLKDALGREVTKSLKPGQEMVGIVHDRLVELLGGEIEDEGEGGAGAGASVRRADLPEPIMRVSPGPAVVMMCGLQGSGKTTTCGKLAAFLKKRGRSVMLVAADLQRPAAVEQLQTVGAQVQTGLPGGSRVVVHAEPDKVREYGKAVGVAVQVCRRALDEARKAGIDTLIIDTAGRLHINDELMGELEQVRRAVNPHHIFLVVDAMTGQDAVTSAAAFHHRLSVDGVILTKFDSDTRGGAALSVKHVTGAPIRFVGVGEKLDALEEFRAERMAGRILGMGDIVSLVEKAQEEVSEEEAERLQKKLAKGEMTMDDFLSQMKSLRRMGPMKQLLGMLPGVGSMLKDVHIEDEQLNRVEAIIHSMTREERTRPDIITHSRRRRIARGSGTKEDEVGKLVKQFIDLNRFTRQMASMSTADRIKAAKQMSSGGMDSMVPGLQGMPQFRGRGSTYTPSVRDKFKKRKR
jgi:signal recognition particle subunit SRP54